MNVLSHSIVRFLNFGVKKKNQKFCPIGKYDEGARLVAMLYIPVKHLHFNHNPVHTSETPTF